MQENLTLWFMGGGGGALSQVLSAPYPEGLETEVSHWAVNYAYVTKSQ